MTLFWKLVVKGNLMSFQWTKMLEMCLWSELLANSCASSIYLQMQTLTISLQLAKMVNLPSLCPKTLHLTSTGPAHLLFLLALQTWKPANRSQKHGGWADILAVCLLEVTIIKACINIRNLIFARAVRPWEHKMLDLDMWTITCFHLHTNISLMAEFSQKPLGT